ncbi:(Fe-S)-binding protein [Paenibacillus koleovorans]|uniref:(Fe-S)-binding protein n=1 Tax=Paenibacillus koleovorans TaxID=121608 RepID=UPI000FD960D2|nr:(Fe-S)-binding protein [Paenibacillus koleovorans]
MSQAPNLITERMKTTLDYDQLTNCMRCGFCQAACPTFIETGIEAASPRGRIALMKAVVDDLMTPDQAFREQMDLCLGCRACEPVCPADVKYGHLLEQTRDVLEEHEEHRWWVKGVRNVMFKQVFPYQKRMKLLGRGLSLYQKTGLRAIVRKTGMMKLFPKNMRDMEAIMPEASAKGVLETFGTFVPAKGKAVARVGMFRGCLMDVLFTETNRNTVKLLAEAGFDVVIPETQSCCGALHAHSGELDDARALAKLNIRAFREANVDYIVSNAGGCGALLVEYDHLLHDDPEAAEDAKWFATRVKDISLILLEKGRLPQFAANHEDKAEVGTGESITITYQDSCHLRNVMRSSSAPRNLMNRVADVRFVELKGADRCCGSAGIYNLVQQDMSNDILEHKMEHVKETNAHYLITSNPGCLLQMKVGIDREQLGDKMEAVHIVDFLYERIKSRE